MVAPFDILNRATVALSSHSQQKLEIIGSDIEALYPSLEAVQVANIVYDAVMESKVKFKGVN